jgi:hypothetical protein
MTCEYKSSLPSRYPVTLLYEPSQDPAVSTLTSKYKPNYSAFIECQSVDAASSEPAASSTSRSDECQVDAGQAEAGETGSIPADLLVTVRRFTPYSTFDGGFERDAGSRGIPEAQQGTGGLRMDEAIISRIRTSVAVTRDQQAGIPLTPYLLTPDIDTRLQAEYLFQDKSLTLQGEVTGDDFPNAEVYVTDRVGNSILLDTFQTDGGRDLGPLLHLPGSGEDSLASFNTQVPLNDDGAFRMTCE